MIHPRRRKTVTRSPAALCSHLLAPLGLTLRSFCFLTSVESAEGQNYSGLRWFVFGVLSPAHKLSGKLNDQHRVAVTIESILLPDGFSIGRQNEVATAGLPRGRKSADEHQQRGAWQVEVGDQSVHYPKRIRRI